MDNIDVVFYINLAHRTDRKEHITSEFKRINIPESKIQRIDAIKMTPGALGCTYSHIKALETFLENSAWNTAMVCEDDFTFNQPIEDKIRLFINGFPKWDALNLSYHPDMITYLDTHKKEIKKALSVVTASCYMITRSMAIKLLENWHIVSKLHVELGTHGHTACDVSWISLQPSANWYVTVPALGYQCDSYSDIINSNVAFRW